MKLVTHVYIIMVCRAGIKHHEQHPTTHPHQQNFRASLLSDNDHPLLLTYHWVVQSTQANDMCQYCTCGLALAQCCTKQA